MKTSIICQKFKKKKTVKMDAIKLSKQIATYKLEACIY